jgi:hypothetical protein
VDARTIRDQRTIADIKFFSVMQNRDLGDRLLRDYIRAIRAGVMKFGRRKRSQGN